MSATFTVNGSDTTIKFSYVATTAKMQSVILDAAEYLWVNETDEDGEITNPFGDATNQEKLDVIDVHVRKVIVNLANTHKSQKAQRLAREAQSDNEHQIS